MAYAFSGRADPLKDNAFGSVRVYRGAFRNHQPGSQLKPGSVTGAAMILVSVGLAATRATAQSQQWSVGSSPAVRIDGATHEFTGLLPVVRLSSGTLVVADRASARVRFFSPEGTLVATAGRAGAGPGEFRSLELVMTTRGDSVWTWDGELRRLTLFAPSGRLVRSVRVLPPGPTGTFDVVGVFGDGSILATVVTKLMPFPGGEGTIVADSLTFMRMTPEGGVTWRLGPFPHQLVFGMSMTLVRRQVREGRGGSPRRGAGPLLIAQPLPFGPRLAWTMTGDTLVFGPGHEVRVTSVDPAGRATPRITAATEIVPIDRGLISAQVAALRERAAAASGGRNAARADSTLAQLLETRGVRLPQTLPAHGRLLIDPNGYLWVQRSPIELPSPGSAVRESWAVHDSRGRLVATLTFPPGFRLDAAGGDVVVGTTDNADGVPSVHVYNLIRHPTIPGR